jgi:hypothetical protein
MTGEPSAPIRLNSNSGPSLRGGKWKTEMDVEQTKALVKFGNLKVTIEGAVDAANGTSEGLAKDLDQLHRALTAERLNRLELGLAALRIRSRCKIDLHWMPVGKVLAQYTHKSYSTLDNIMKAAAKAATLGEYRLAALIGEGIDPSERKYDHLLDDLLGTAFSGSPMEAREVVRQALARFRSARKQVADESRRDRAAAEQDSPSRMRRIVSFREGCVTWR